MKEDEITIGTVRKADGREIYKVYESWPSHALEAWRSKPQLKHRRSYGRVVYFGMGGSAAAGEILSDWLLSKGGVELSVFKGSWPRMDLSSALVVVCSASGNTEETLRMAEEGLRRRAEMVIITSGGRLEAFAVEKRIPLVKIPLMFAPRYTLPHLVFSTLAVLREASLLHGLETEIEESISTMKKVAPALALSSPAKVNPAKRLARTMVGERIKIYGSSLTKGVAFRFKNSLNENAKYDAFADAAPEIFHNEVETWQSGGAGYLAIFLRSDHEPDSEKKKLDHFESLLRKMKVSTCQITGEGRGALGQLMSMVYEVDFAAYYTAIIRGIDPYYIKVIDDLKAV